MFAAFRRLSKSTAGKFIMILFVVAMMGSFAVADMNGVGSGSLGLGGGVLAKAGKEQVTERQFDDVFSRALAQAREKNPEATAATIANDVGPIFEEMINQALLGAFATKQDILLSKRLIDAEIAKIPAARGLDGKFSNDAYLRWLQSQRLTDAFVRQIIRSDLTQRMVLLPVATSARTSVGMATPYASMLLEQRQGEVVLVSTDAFKAGLSPTAGNLQAFYDQNKSRYMVPEQRVLRIAPINAASVPVAAPSEQEIAAYFKANAASLGGVEKRVLSQAVVPDQATAKAIAERARGGASFADAAKPAGFTAEDVSVGPQTRAEFVNLTNDSIAATVFGAAPGAVLGPIKSDLGWHVIKVDSVQGADASSLDKARPQIVAKLTEEKRKNAVADLVGKIEDSIADGSSLADAAKAANLSLTETPLITAAGVARADPAFKLPPAYAKLVKTGFDLTSDDDPVVETLADGSGYALVGLGRIVPAAPAPLADIRDRVVADWTQHEAARQARATAAAIAAKVASGTPMADAAKAAGKGVSTVKPVSARRIQLAQADDASAAPIRMLFSLSQGKSRMVADPQERGFFVVRNLKVTPGNAAGNPALITQVQQGFQQSMSGELAQQFMIALRNEIGVKRDDKAIAAAKARLTQTGN